MNLELERKVEQVIESKIHDLIVLGYGWGGSGLICDLSDPRIEKEIKEILADIKSAKQEAYELGRKEERERIKNIITTKFKIAREEVKALD
jgi:hypothetical protein